MAERTPGWTAYADGSCIGNPGRGGWGVVLIDPDGVTSEIAGADPQTTNNRMEITAALEALRRVPVGAQIAIHSDSQYVIKTMTLGWRRRENLDLWAPLDQAAAGRKVRWEWVRGHSGDPLNERADELARAAAEERAPRARPTTAVAADDPIESAIDGELMTRVKPLLRPGEDVRHCRGCRRPFVAVGDAHCCSLVACQIKARAARPRG